MFEQAFLENSGRTNRPWTVVVSFAGQVLLVGAGVLVPLISTDVLPRAQLSGILFGPGPPPGKAENAERIPRPKGNSQRIPRQATRLGLLEPRRMPARPAAIVEAEEPPMLSGAGTAMGVPGGIGDPGGALNSIIGQMLGARSVPQPPESARTVRKASEEPGRFRVGGLVRPPIPLSTPDPGYPPLAIQMRIEGTVRLEAVIGTNGTIRHIRLVDGHPLLVSAAINAVKQWRYTPSLLNGDPIEVVMQIDVNFSLSRR